uniref:Ceramide synthase 4 n=1 Tax=Nothobranchius kuhntae TaxID=321403 RepID=A0A1A8JGF8_NOTKU
MDLLPDLWREDYWLPPGVTWGDMEQLVDTERPQPHDLLMALPLALGFVALRYAFERFLAPPMGRCLGVKNTVHVTAAPSLQLESFYTQRSKQPTQREIIHLMLACGKTQRQIETWFRRRRNQDRPSRTKKFAEAAWRFFFYLAAFMAGLACLVDRPWFWDHRECWRRYPVQPMERAHFWYYMLELGFYGSLLLRISVDIKRKDFKEQVIHHLATIFLLSFSYCANYIRIGTLVMLLHDSSDIFKIIRNTLLLSMEAFEPFPGYYFFNILLMVLQVLHIFWACLILRMVCKFLKGKLEKDERSDEESGVEEEEEEKGGEENTDQGGDCYWGKSKDNLNSKISMLTNSCVLNNLNHHRSSVAKRMRKAQ